MTYQTMLAFGTVKTQISIVKFVILGRFPCCYVVVELVLYVHGQQ